VETNDSSSEQDGESDNSQENQPESEQSYGGTAQGDQTPVSSTEEPEVRTCRFSGR